MKQIFKNILDYAKRYPFTSIAIVISTLISTFMFLMFLDGWKPTEISLWGILPTFIFILGAFIWQKLFKDKHKKLQGTLLLFINITFLWLQILYSFIIAVSGAEYLANRPLNDYKRYDEVLKMNDEYLKEVFPETIPKDAEKIRMSGSVSSPIAVYYRKNIALSFNATPEFVDNELKRFKDAESYKIGRSDKVRGVFPVKHMDDGDYSVYFVLGKTEHPDINHENYFRGGCLINKDSNRVVYYYEKIYGDYCHECYKEGGDQRYIDLKDYGTIY